MDSAPDQRRFPTTRWTLVLAAGDARSPGAESALSTLCEAYWFPVYAFIRRTGCPSEEARDLTQGFFTRVLEKNYFGDAKQERGRFRTFLLSAVRHFIANERDRHRTQKRGCGQVPLALAFDDGERRYQHESVDHDTPDRVFERRWALAVLAAAMSRVATAYEGERPRQVFDRLRPFLTGDELESFATLSADLRMSEGALRVALHRLRRQFGSRLRDVISETVAGDDDVDDELRHLVTIVSR